MATFDKVRDIVVDQLGVEADEVNIDSTFMIWALTPSTSLN